MDSDFKKKERQEDVNFLKDCFSVKQVCICVISVCFFIL